MRRTVVLCLLITLSAVWLWGQAKTRRPPRRAKPPQFKTSDVQGVFFADIFAESGPLVGTRPKILRVSPAAVVDGSGRKSAPDEGNANTSASGWSNLIASTTIEDEVKSVSNALKKDITRPSSFASGGHRKCRTHYSVLAMMFAIAGEYDGDVRWKKDAPVARDMFAQTAANCTTNSIAAFNKAKRDRDETLQSLLEGSGVAASKSPERSPDWSTVTDRGPLMKRLQRAVETNLQPWTAGKGEFAKNTDQIAHEAQIVAALAEILMKDTMPDYDAEDYSGPALQMKEGALQVLSALKLKDDVAAGKAVGEMRKACASCHSVYN